jgi:adenylate cyclase
MTPHEWPPGHLQPDIRCKAIAFLDCCGYSAYTQLHGDLAAVDVHLRMRGTVEREALETQVEVVKWMGDGAMLAADECNAMLSCVYRTMVLARDAALLPLRSGMAYGPVATITREKVDYFGASVNRAAQLCSAAAPWQLRADTGRGREMAHFTLLSDTARSARGSVVPV